MNIFMRSIAVLSLSLWTISATAAEEETAELEAEAEAELMYVEITPAFVTNYERGARLKYMKADVSLRVTTSIAYKVRHHMPFIKNSLILMFSEQEEENLTSTTGREVLRREALEEVRRVMGYLEPGSATEIENLYFTNFIVQQ